MLHIFRTPFTKTTLDGCLFKTIKLNKDLIAKFVVENFNSCIDEGEFPSGLKNAGIVSIHDNKDKGDKSNYRPVSIISNYSKVYEKTYQLYQYFENILFQSQCGFRKGSNTQHCLLALIEKVKGELFWLTCQKHLIALITPY